jgi:hypothetical protein
MGKRHANPAVKVALLGGGAHGLGALGAAVAALPNWSIVAMADPASQARGAAVKLIPHVRVFASVAELLAAGMDFDLAVIATPPAATLEVALAALASGARILVEKPGARSHAEIDQLQAAPRGHLAGFAYNYRFHPAIQELRAILTDQRAPLRRLELRFDVPLDPANTWRASQAAGGGALRDLGSHLLDLAAWLTGSPLEVLAATISSRRSEDDDAHLCLRAGETEVDLHCAYHGTPTFLLRAESQSTSLLTELWTLAKPVRLCASQPLASRARLWTSRLACKIPGRRPAQGLRASRSRMLVAALGTDGMLASAADAAAVLGWVAQAEAIAHPRKSFTAGVAAEPPFDLAPPPKTPR